MRGVRSRGSHGEPKATTAPFEDLIARGKGRDTMSVLSKGVREEGRCISVFLSLHPSDTADMEGEEMQPSRMIADNSQS